MKRSLFFKILVFTSLALSIRLVAQNPNPVAAPYCTVSYGSGQCNQPGPSNTAGNFINDFINCVQTSGANTNINNCNSGCNGNPGNYGFYCQHYLQLNAGQTVSIAVQSGSVYSQGFAVFVDWNQDNIFSTPSEYMCGSNTVPAAGTFTTLVMNVPANIPPGTYRMRIRCSFATTGPNIPPCGQQTYGETEDYNIYIGPIPPNSGVVSVTATVNSPVCAGQTLTFSAVANATSGITYSWTGPNSFTNTSPYFILANASPSLNGNYTVVANNGNCPGTAIVSVQVVPYPTFSVNPTTTTICQGGSFNVAAVIQGTSTPGQFNYIWTPLTNGGIATPFAQATSISPPLLAPSVTMATIGYSVTVTPTALACSATQSMAVTINNPLTPTLTMPQRMCNTSPAVTLSASPGGGTWTAIGSNAVTQAGLFTPSAANIGGPNLVKYSVSAGKCIVSNTDTVHVAQFNTAALSNSITLTCERDAPINLMNIVINGTAGVWSGGPYVNSNYFNPGGLSSGTYSLMYNTWSTPAPPYATVCPASTVITVQVFNPPIPTINPIAEVCNTHPTVALSASPSGGTWNLCPGVSINGIQIPSLCAVTNSVLYSVGIGTCDASSTATFQVSQFVPATLTGTVGHLCSHFSVVNLMNIVQNTVTGSWTGSNVVSAANGGYSFSPTGLATGIYTVNYNTHSVPNPLICPDSKSLTISVLNPPVPNIPAQGPYCTADGTIQLQVTPANSGTWVSTPYISSSGIFNPNKSAVGVNPVQYITGTPTCSATHSRNINVEAFITSTIISGIPDLCATSPTVDLSLLPFNTLGTWGGPGVSGANFLPAAAGAGVHILTYSTSSLPSGLCPDQSTLAVKVFSLATPAIDPAGPFCSKEEPVKLKATPLGGVFSGYGIAINSEGLFSPSLADIGKNIVSYTVTSGPCIGYAQATISVEKFISAALASSQTVSLCSGDPPFNLMSFAQNPDGSWSGNGGTVTEGRMFDPSKASVGSNNKVIYTVFSKPGGYCKDESSMYISVNETPTVDLVVSPDTATGCNPFPVTLQLKPKNGGPGGRADWYIGDGSDVLHGLTVEHTYNLPGTYTVVANYVTSAGCKTQSTLDTVIRVLQSPSAYFLIEPDEITISNPDALFINKSTVLSDNKYQWTISSIGLRTDVNPKVTFPAIGSYHIKLLATSFNGCKDEMTAIVNVKNEFNVYIPSSFSPNSDGLNDLFFPVFSPYGLDTKSFSMSIFDRWGKLVYDSKDVTKGWDGTYFNKGDLTLKEGVFVYLIKFKDNEGRVYERNGTVTLIGN